MPNPSQHDYTSDNTLVPGSLTVFRHFHLDINTGSLGPMTNQIQWWMADSRLEPFRYRPDVEVHRAHCSTHPHLAPQKHCRCGFYASYDPATDFYPEAVWGKGVSTGLGRRWHDGIAVRAAVEVTGTVVMGRLGVRAEKVKILAIAPDWSKHRPSQELGLNDWSISDPVADVDTDIYWDEYGQCFMRRTLVAKAREEQRGEVIRSVRAAAESYGVVYYDDPVDMHAAHPMADLDALGIDTSPPPTIVEGVHRGIYVRRMAAYAQVMDAKLAALDSASVSLRGFADIMQRLFDRIDRITPARPAPTQMTRFEAAIEAKRNRPAPPGSGIDRRRRKL